MSVRKFRDQKKKEEDFDIRQGHLPEDFDNHENRALAINSAAFILTARRNNGGGIAPIDLNMQKDVIAKSVQYLAEFVVDGQNPEVEHNKMQIWQTEFSALNLSNFECAQLLNLRPASSDEAKTLITSFERFDTPEEVELLDSALLVLKQ